MSRIAEVEDEPLGNKCAHISEEIALRMILTVKNATE
jgi:hypothetical protein